MMYAGPVVDEPLAGQLTDADLERFGWFVLMEREGVSQYRIITMERPA